MLLGVEAPAVSPTATRPSPAASSGVTCSRHRRGRRRADRPVPDLVGRDQAGRVGDVERRHAVGADPRQVAGVAAVVAADRRRIRSSGSLVEQRDDGVLALLRRAADRVERAEARGQRRPRRSDRASPAGTSRRSPATRTSASSSGWRSRCARGRASGSKPGETASPKRARNARGVAAVADVVADDRRLRPRSQHDQVVAAGILQRLRRGRARLLVLDLAVDDRR